MDLFCSKCGLVLFNDMTENIGKKCPKCGGDYLQIKDIVNAPDHYRDIPGIECIDVTKHFNFARGSALKYIWRAGKKDKSKEIEDLQKAIKYLQIEIERLNNDN